MVNSASIDVFGDGDGAAVGVDIDVTEDVVLTNASIRTSTQRRGDAGDIRITAGSLQMKSVFMSSVTLSSDGRAGDITVETATVTLTDGVSILSLTIGPGQGGTVMVRATEAVTLDGFSGIFANALGQSAGSGAAGAVWVEAPVVTVSGGAQIGSGTFSPGQGGTVTVTATNIVVIARQDSGLFTNTNGPGQGGSIMVQTQQLQLTDGAMISSASAGVGNAGDIRIEARDMTLRGNSAVTTSVGRGTGRGGNILIGGTISDEGAITARAETLILDRSRIAADTDTGDEANITIGAQRVVLDEASAITANTGAGDGGNIIIGGTVLVGGSITTGAEAIVLRNSQITAQAGQGTGGRIDIVAEAFLAGPNSVVDASSQAGIDGEVNIEGIVTNLSQIVTPLPQQFAQVSSLLRDPCGARLQQGGLSSFVVREHIVPPITPDGMLPSPLYARRLKRPSPEGTAPRGESMITAQQGMVHRPCR